MLMKMTMTKSTTKNRKMMGMLKVKNRKARVEKRRKMRTKRMMMTNLKDVRRKKRKIARKVMQMMTTMLTKLKNLRVLLLLLHLRSGSEGCNFINDQQT